VKKGISILLSIIGILALSLVIGGMLSVIIGFRYDRFVWISPTVVILDSLFLGLGLLVSMYFIRFLAPSAVSVISMLMLAFALMLGIGIISFMVFFIADPVAFLYSDNRTITYLLINLLFFISINIIISGFVVFQQIVLDREKALLEESALKTQMELQLLSSKVNPHFLFNSLNLMVSLLKTPRQAETALINLAEILRYQLDFSAAQSVSLASELKIVEKYLSIQQLRFGSKLSYQIDCEVETRIPPMIIQPLVENSIKHNIDITPHLAIEIAVCHSNEAIIIQVRDSMARMTPDMFNRGIGLTVTAKRVELMGGRMSIENGGVEISVKP